MFIETITQVPPKKTGFAPTEKRFMFDTDLILAFNETDDEWTTVYLKGVGMVGVKMKFADLKSKISIQAPFAEA